MKKCEIETNVILAVYPCKCSSAVDVMLAVVFIDLPRDDEHKSPKDVDIMLLLRSQTCRLRRM